MKLLFRIDDTSISVSTEEVTRFNKQSHTDYKNIYMSKKPYPLIYSVHQGSILFIIMPISYPPYTFGFNMSILPRAHSQLVTGNFKMVSGSGFLAHGLPDEFQILERGYLLVRFVLGPFPPSLLVQFLALEDFEGC